MFNVTDKDSAETSACVFPHRGLFACLGSWLSGSTSAEFVVEVEGLEFVQTLKKTGFTSVNPFLQRFQLI